MKQGHYITIDKAFKGYKNNIADLKNYPHPYAAGADYTNIEKKDVLEKQVKLVEEVMRWLEIEGYGRERYIKYRYLKGLSNLNTCIEIGVDERTGKRWKRDIFEKAESIGLRMGMFK